MEIKGKIAVVTGAASGIGRAAALALAREGADVVVADLNDAGLTEILKEIERLGRRGLAVSTDVARLPDVQNLFHQSISEMGRVDILMNNAGVHMMGNVEKVTIEDWKWIIDINLWGVIHGIHVFLPHLLERGSGHIINTASLAGLAGGLDGSIPYTTTKFAVVGLSEGLAVYLRGKGIGVTALCPGLVSTNIMNGQRFIPTGDGLDQSRQDLLKILAENFKDGKLPDFVPKSALTTVVSPDRIAAEVVRAIRENIFLVVMPEEVRELISQRAQNMETFINQHAQMRAEMETLLNLVFTQMAKAKSASP